MSNDIANRIYLIQKEIQKTAVECQRAPQSITLLAISKGQNAAAITTAFQAGLTDFGENYWQEAYAKIQSLQQFPIIWHFTGSLQSNKISRIAEYFQWVHTVDREKTALLLSEHRPAHLPPLNVCLQVNLDNEPNKTGSTLEELPQLAELVSQLPGLRLRGLMAIPKREVDESLQILSFHRLTYLLTALNKQLTLSMDTLSMGMSDDFTPAIRAGSTIVRIGRAIFGQREERL